MEYRLFYTFDGKEWIMDKVDENLKDEKIVKLDYESVEEAGGGSDIGKKINSIASKSFDNPNDKQPWEK